MAQPQKEPLRSLTAEERAGLEALARAGSERADRVARAKALLAVAEGAPFAAAARAAGRRSGVAVAQLVRRFNAEGLRVLTPGHGGGPAVLYARNLRPDSLDLVLMDFPKRRLDAGLEFLFAGGTPDCPFQFAESPV